MKLALETCVKLFLGFWIVFFVALAIFNMLPALWHAETAEEGWVQE